MKTVEVLTNALALIATESTWREDGSFTLTPGRIRGSIYEDASGNNVLQLSKATCFCSLGAINAAVGADAECCTSGLKRAGSLPDAEFYAKAGTTAPTKAQRKAYWNAVKYLREAIKEVTGCTDIVGLNDAQNSHENVVASFKLAIKNAKRRHPCGGRLARSQFTNALNY